MVTLEREPVMALRAPYSFLAFDGFWRVFDRCGVEVYATRGEGKGAGLAKDRARNMAAQLNKEAHYV